MACISSRRGRLVIDFYDQHGQRRWKTLPENTTKKKARKELAEIEKQIERKTFIPINEVPLFSKVAADWLEHKEQFVRKNTLDTYRIHVEKHFAELDPLKVNQISIARVEKFIAAQSKLMHINTLRKNLMILGQIFAYAIRHKYVDYNPVRDAEKPREVGQEGERDHEKIKILTPEQITSLLDAETDQEYRMIRMIFTLAVFSGARQGEILGLRWMDMDWINKQVHIDRTFNNGTLYNTKTKTSSRRIDLGPMVLTELKKWKLVCPKSELGLMFPDSKGGHIEHHNLVNRHFHPAREKACLPRIRFHDLRHSYASLMIGMGENLKYIQTQLGHSSPTVTLNVYAHLLKPTNPEAALRLEETIFGGHGSKMVAGDGRKVENA
jgi:integrase